MRIGVFCLMLAGACSDTSAEQKGFDLLVTEREASLTDARAARDEARAKVAAFAARTDEPCVAQRERCEQAIVGLEAEIARGEETIANARTAVGAAQRANDREAMLRAMDAFGAAWATPAAGLDEWSRTARSIAAVVESRCQPP